MSCELKRASPYSVDLRWWPWCYKMTILRHGEVTSMYGNDSTQRILQNPVVLTLHITLIFKDEGCSNIGVVEIKC